MKQVCCNMKICKSTTYTYIHLVLRSGMNAAVSVLLHVPSWRAQKQIHFYDRTARTLHHFSSGTPHGISRQYYSQNYSKPTVYKQSAI